MRNDTSHVIGLGGDLASIARVRAVCERQGASFLSLVYTDAEVEAAETSPDTHRRLAELFAAKEAISKAMGTGWAGGVTFADIELAVPERGSPMVRYHGRAAAHVAGLRVTATLVSLSRHGDLVAATAILMGDEA